MRNDDFWQGWVLDTRSRCLGEYSFQYLAILFNLGIISLLDIGRVCKLYLYSKPISIQRMLLKPYLFTVTINLNFKIMRSLREFVERQEVFKDPQHLPEFFEQNLVDPARVVKVFFDDPQAHIKVFYYQYLKLCFEINNFKSQQLVHKIEELINNPTFQFIFYQEDDPNVFNDNQAKAFIMEFFGELSSGESTILEAINKYPIMDIIMVHFFRTLMILMDKTESLDNFIPRDELLAFLCPFFGIDVEVHDNCVKYVDTDVFVFDESERAVYMAYINITEDNEGPQELNSQEIIDQYAQGQPNNFAPQSTVSNTLSQQNNPRVVVEAKESYIASEWNDYTYNPNADRLVDKGARILKGSEHEFDNFGKSEVQKVSQNYLNSYEKQEPLFNPEPKQTLNYKDTFSASINSGSDNKNVQSLSGQSGYGGQSSFGQHSYNPPQQTYGQADYLASSNPPKTSGYNAPPPSSNISSNNLQSSGHDSFASSYKPPVTQPIPTKDYSQPNNFMSSTNYQTSKAADVAPQKLVASSYESSLTKDLIYTPKIDPPFQAPPNNSVAIGGPQYGASGVQSATTGGKKKVFGLNVSDEFTNSWTIKKMAEPFRSNVVNIKTRARQFRSSLSGYIK